MNEKPTLYIHVSPFAIMCDWEPLRLQPDKREYRPYKYANHAEVTLMLAKTKSAKLRIGAINFEIMRALQAVGIHAGALQDTGFGKRGNE